MLSGPAIERINESPIEHVFVHEHAFRSSEKLAAARNLTPLSVAPLLGEAIRRIHQGASVSSLFV